MGKHRRDRHKKNKPNKSSSEEVATTNPSNVHNNGEDSLSPSTPKPDIYVNGIKSVEDYGDYIILKAGKINKYNYKLFTKPTGVLSTACYEPLSPFLDKYSKLYYEPDGIIEDLLTCFIDW
jgi:hypothetical protein